MEIYEIVIIALAGTAAASFTVFYTVKSIRSKDRCSYCAFKTKCPKEEKDNSEKCDKFVDSKK